MNPAIPPDDATMGNDTMGPPPEPDAAPMGGMNELCVPLGALAMEGEDNNTETPQVGDRGQAMVEYKVSRIDGDNAYIQPVTVNGQEMTEAPAPEATGPDESAQLQAMAAQQPPY